MSDSYIQLQVPLGPTRPAWEKTPPRNGMWDYMREQFALGNMTWSQDEGFVARLFDTSFQPDFSVQLGIWQVPSTIWMSEPVPLQEVGVRDGYCLAHGVRFAEVDESRQLGGVAIYELDGWMIWAATDWVGNIPILQQDVYLVWDATYGGPFRL